MAVSFIGDGGSNQGTTFEAMIMAVVLKLPAVFVFENNQYCEGTGSTTTSEAITSPNARRVSAWSATTMSSLCPRRRAKQSSALTQVADPAPSRSIPAAFTAITWATPSSITAKTKSGACATSALREALPPSGRRGRVARHVGT